MAIREGGYGLRIRPYQLKKRFCAGNLSPVLPPKLAMPGWNWAHLGWGELLQTPPTSAAPSSPRFPAPSRWTQHRDDVKGVDGAEEQGQIFRRGAVFGGCCSLQAAGVWGLCVPSGFSGASSCVRAGKGEDIWAELWPCWLIAFPETCAWLLGLGKEVPSLVYPWGLRQWSLLCVCAGLAGGNSSKICCEIWGGMWPEFIQE